MAKDTDSKPDKPEKPAKAPKAEKGDRPSKPPKGEKAEKGAKGEKGEKGEKKGKAAAAESRPVRCRLRAFKKNTLSKCCPRWPRNSVARTGSRCRDWKRLL